MFVLKIGDDYNEQRDHFQQKENCIKDPKWRKVITDLYSFSSLDKFKSVAYVFLILFCFVLVLGGALLGWSLSKLGKR